jgi:hypothetical protein
MHDNKSTPNKNARPRRRRREADLCEHTQSWIWLGSVRARRPELSYDALDDLVFEEGSRRRAFWRIACTGQSPDRVHPRRGFSLVDRLGKLSGLEETVAVFRSRLWRLLQPRPLSREVLLALKTELLEAFNLYQPEHRAEIRCTSWYVIELSYVAKTSAREMADCLRALAAPLCLDWLALLCVFYRLAVDELDLEAAIELRDLMRDHYTKVLQALDLGRFGLRGAEELRFLIEARVLRGDTHLGSAKWALETVPPLVKGYIERSGEALQKVPRKIVHELFMLAIDSATPRGRTCGTLLVRPAAENRSAERGRISPAAERERRARRILDAEFGGDTTGKGLGKAMTRRGDALVNR